MEREAPPYTNLFGSHGVSSGTNGMFEIPRVKKGTFTDAFSREDGRVPTLSKHRACIGLGESFRATAVAEFLEKGGAPLRQAA